MLGSHLKKDGRKEISFWGGVKTVQESDFTDRFTAHGRRTFFGEVPETGSRMQRREGTESFNIEEKKAGVTARREACQRKKACVAGGENARQNVPGSKQ